VRRSISDDYVRAGNVIVADNPGRLAAILGWTKDQVTAFLESKSKFPHYGYFFGWVYNPKKYHDFTAEEIEAFKPFATVTTAYRVYPADGEPRIVVGVKSLAQFWPNVKLGTIAFHLQKEGSAHSRSGIRVVRL